MQEDAGVVAAKVDALESLEGLRGICSKEGAAWHLDVEPGIDAPILLDAVVIQVRQEIDVRADAQHVFALGTEAAHEKLLCLSHVDARDIPQLSAEALAAVDVVHVVKPCAIPVKEIEVVGRTAAARAVEFARLAGHHLAGERPGVVELETRVESCNAIVTAGELTVGV